MFSHAVMKPLRFEIFVENCVAILIFAPQSLLVPTHFFLRQIATLMHFLNTLTQFLLDQNMTQ